MSLSRPQPNAQSLWVALLAGEQTDAIPGLFKIGELAFAEQLGWPLEGFRKAFREVFAKGLAKADWDARLVWVPNAIKWNPPANPNIVTMWREPWRHLPECGLKLEAYQHLKGFAEGLSEGFREAFAKALPKPVSSDQLAVNSEKEILDPRVEEPRRRTRRTPSAPDADAPVPGSDRVVEAWFKAYEAKYKQKPKWGGRQGKQLKALLKGSGYTVDELVALVPYFFAWQRPDVIKAGHSWGTGYACFVLKLDELRADIADQDRRKDAAVIAEREKQRDSIAVDDDELNRINALAAAQRNPFDERQWRSVGEIGPAGSGSVDQGNQAALGSAQQAVEPSRHTDLVSSAGAVRKTGEPLARAGSLLRGGSLPFDRPGQIAHAGTTGNGEFQTDSPADTRAEKAR